MSQSEPSARYMQVLTRSVMSKLDVLAKWRTHFAGWQLGTRPKGDPECDAVSNHREATIILRAEASALIGLLIEKGVITQEDWLLALGKEAEQLAEDYARRWPGARATPDGMAYDIGRAQAWMKDWKP